MRNSPQRTQRPQRKDKPAILLCALCASAVFFCVPADAQQAIILRGPQPETDPNLLAYSVALDSVAISWRIATQLDSLPELLIVPARTARGLSAADVDRIEHLVNSGAVLVTEEITPLAERLGFAAGATVETTQIVEAAYPDVMIVWQRPGGVVSLQPPSDAEILTREKWTGAPLAALLTRGRGRALVLAIELDPVQGEGYARFPYFTHALRRAGVVFPFRSERLSALFDYSYRTAVDLNYFAKRWRRAGIQTLHVSAWHFWDRDAQRDDYLERLIVEAHRNGILVYAWLELPHVSIAFWEKHPGWREKTATGQDAHLDWRYLMNLKNSECFNAVGAGLRDVLRRFDWDGVNLSELYFESPQGPQNPQRLTPFNDDVRAEFKARHRIDPLSYFRADSPVYWKTNPREWAKFVNYRVEQVRALNERSLQLLAEFKREKPHLGIALTFVDNLYDPKMREALGADIHAMLPLLDRYDFTLIMEDPGTVWHLGPRRYTDLAQSYAKLTRHGGRLGIDINIVERWQDVYPTKKQTGVEFLQLFHHAGKNFRTVLVYFEQSILRQDLELVSHALASGATVQNGRDESVVKTAAPVVFVTNAPNSDFEVNGARWPAVEGGSLLLPAGTHRIRAVAATASSPRLVKLAGDLLTARYDGAAAIEFSYASPARAIAIFDRRPNSLSIDEAATSPPSAEWILLPSGSHRIRAGF